MSISFPFWEFTEVRNYTYVDILVNFDPRNTFELNFQRAP